LLGKIDGLSEYDARRPLTATGTNLLGLLKHVAGVQLWYFGACFDRPSERDELPWMADDAPPNADMWVPANETRDEIVDIYNFSSAHSDASIEALELDSPGVVPWWPEERRNVTLQRVLVHMCVEMARHAGHADIVRELIDNRIGNGPDDPNLPGLTAQDWAEYRGRVEAAAASFR
jgi:hypothetical protein